MRHGQDWLRPAGVAAVVVLALSWASPAWAPNCATCKMTGLMLRLSGTFFFPPNPVLPAGENVSLVGDAHVVTKVGPNYVTEVYLNMAVVNGLGATTGNMYIGTGSNKLLGVQLIPNHYPAGPIRANFTLEPADGSASVPLPLTFELVPGRDGTLLPSSTVRVTSGGPDSRA